MVTTPTLLLKYETRNYISQMVTGRATAVGQRCEHVRTQVESHPQQLASTSPSTNHQKQVLRVTQQRTGFVERVISVATT